MSLRRAVPCKGAYRPRYQLARQGLKKRRSYQEAMWAMGCPHAKLVVGDVLAIRRRWVETGGQITRFCRGEVARLQREGVTMTVTAIRQLVTRETWSWVPEP